MLPNEFAGLLRPARATYLASLSPDQLQAFAAQYAAFLNTFAPGGLTDVCTAWMVLAHWRHQGLLPAAQVSEVMR